MSGNSFIMSTATFIAVFGIVIMALIPGSSAQLRLEFCGSTELPSLKCIMNPGRFDLNIQNRTLCFCVMIQGSIPTYNCIRADGKVTMDDLRELIGTIRNLTSVFPPLPTQPPSANDGSGGGGVPNLFSALPNFAQGIASNGFGRRAYDPNNETPAESNPDANDEVVRDTAAFENESQKDFENGVPEDADVPEALSYFKF